MSKSQWARFVFLAALVLGLVFFASLSPARADLPGQLPTVAIPTVTGTPSGPKVQVIQQVSVEHTVNLWAGPDTAYGRVGILMMGETVPATGRTKDGEWIEVIYMGVPGSRAWVYAPLVTTPSGSLPLIDPPATPTPRVTATIDPTLAAKYEVAVEPTRLPTFTAPAPVATLAFTDVSDTGSSLIPEGLIILTLVMLGFFIALIAFLRR